MLLTSLKRPWCQKHETITLFSRAFNLTGFPTSNRILVCAAAKLLFLYKLSNSLTVAFFYYFDKSFVEQVVNSLNKHVFWCSNSVIALRTFCCKCLTELTIPYRDGVKHKLYCIWIQNINCRKPVGFERFSRWWLDPCMCHFRDDIYQTVYFANTDSSAWFFSLQSL